MENKRSDLEQFLKRLERCGDLGLAAQRAGVSNEQLDQWIFGDASDIGRKIALARYKGSPISERDVNPDPEGAQ